MKALAFLLLLLLPTLGACGGPATDPEIEASGTVLCSMERSEVCATDGVIAYYDRRMCVRLASGWSGACILDGVQPVQAVDDCSVCAPKP